MSIKTKSFSPFKRIGTNTVLKNIGDNVGIGTDTPPRALSVGSTEAKGLFFDANLGYLGIGRDNPQEQLDMWTSAQDAEFSFSLFSDNSGNEQFLAFKRSHTDTPGGNTATISGERLGRFTFYGNSGSGFTTAARIFVDQIANGSGLTATPARMKFVVGRLDGSGTDDIITLRDGKVGIGTDLPNAKLEIGGDTPTYIRFSQSAHANSLWNFGPSNSGTSFSLYNQYRGWSSISIEESTNNIRLVSTTGNVGLGLSTPLAQLHTTGGRIVKTTRVTTTYTALGTDEVIFCDTDGGAFTITLPEGIEGTHYKIINCGTSSNLLTIDGNGTETVYGELTQELSDGDVIDLNFNTTEGWW